MTLAVVVPGTHNVATRLKPLWCAIAGGAISRRPEAREAAAQQDVLGLGQQHVTLSEKQKSGLANQIVCCHRGSAPIAKILAATPVSVTTSQIQIPIRTAQSA